jgi:1,4-dihydroxy-2-naphthoyl-CoA hydrolase
MIWKVKPDLETLNNIGEGNMVAHLGITVVEIGDDFIKAKMPVDHRTKQPMGLLHGGASVALSESMGSFASFLTLDDISKQQTVGVEINANHLKPVKSGYVYATTTPVKLGRRLQIWDTKITDEESNVVCVSRLTTMIIDTKG